MRSGAPPVKVARMPPRCRPEPARLVHRRYTGRVAEYDEVGGCHRVVYDDGEEAWENLCGDGRSFVVLWRWENLRGRTSASRELQADSEAEFEAEADSEAEAEVEVETEAEVAPPKTASQPQPKRPASPVNPPSEPSQRRQRGSTSEPHAQP